MKVSQRGLKPRRSSPRRTMASARPAARARAGIASGFRVGIAHPDQVIGAHVEPLDLLREAEDLVELPQEEPADLLLQAPLHRGGPLAALRRVEELLVLLDQALELALGVPVAERRVGRQEALREVR